jgi:hypothetical protein
MQLRKVGKALTFGERETSSSTTPTAKIPRTSSSSNHFYITITNSNTGDISIQHPETKNENNEE